MTYKVLGCLIKSVQYVLAFINVYYYIFMQRNPATAFATELFADLACRGFCPSPSICFNNLITFYIILD